MKTMAVEGELYEVRQTTNPATCAQCHFFKNDFCTFPNGGLTACLATIPRDNYFKKAGLRAQVQAALDHHDQ